MSTTVEAKRIKELEREVKDLCRTNEILKMASSFFAQAELDHRLKGTSHNHQISDCIEVRQCQGTCNRLWRCRFGVS